MHDAPSMAVKQKKKSSMRVCFDLVKAGEADAVVSAGNSGAMMACGLFVLGRLPGVERPAIVTTFPTKAGECALLDMGANVDPKPAVLAQFAVLGAVYARLLHGKGRPKVGLLSNGSEEHKGTPLTREAHQLAGRAPAGGPAPISTTSATSRGGTSFGARSTSSSPTASPATSCSRASRGPAEAIMAWCARRSARSGLLAKLGAALMTGALAPPEAPHRLRRARRRAAAGRRRASP